MEASKNYDSIYQLSIDPSTCESFWEEQAKEIYWSQKFTQVLDSSQKPFYYWFPDGYTNICFNALDRHILNGYGDNNCIIYENGYNLDPQILSYKDVHNRVCRLANYMLSEGIVKGDRVIIYMPMIPEGIISMLACARIGAIHSVVFGGFAANELENRISDAKPKLIITASVGIEPRKKINYYPIVKEAIKNHDGVKILIYQRKNVYVEENFDPLITKDFEEELEKASDENECEWVESKHPLYILYTSGTTGTPKGIVRETGGTCVALNYSCKINMNLNIGDISFSTSDIGWVVGHSYIVYGPLIRGCTTIIFEGKPVGTPNCEVLWNIIDKYKVNSFYTSPTALRAIKREDSDSSLMLKNAMSTLTGVHMAGERCDPDTINWLTKGMPEKVLINDSWWQTETGWHISGNNLGIQRFSVKPGSATRPLPGFNVKIINEENGEEILEPCVMGQVCSKLPMPPSFMLTLWQNDQAFLNKYISKDNNYYKTGDSGYFDEDGYLSVLTRDDDMLKVAGHRLSTGRIEECINYSKYVVESAVVGKDDDLKAEVPFAFVVAQLSVVTEDDKKELMKDVNSMVVDNIGAISRLGGMIIVNKLPKTRSGKTLRGVLRRIINKQEYALPPTIEDASVVDDIIEELKRLKLI